MKYLAFCLMIGVPALAQDLTEPGGEAAPAADVERDPAALVIQPRKRTYPGGAWEEDLKVQANLPGADVKVDARTLQRDVYKSVYNQELKEERHDYAAEE